MEITKSVLKLEVLCSSEVPKVISQTDFILHQNKVNAQNEIVDTLYSTVYIQIIIGRPVHRDCSSSHYQRADLDKR